MTLTYVRFDFADIVEMNAQFISLIKPLFHFIQLRKQVHYNGQTFQCQSFHGNHVKVEIYTKQLLDLATSTLFCAKVY